MIGYTPTPDYYNDYICHYGVKGMKWGKRKTRAQIQKSKAHKVHIKTYNYGTKKKTLKDKFNDHMSKRQDIYDNPNEINTLPINVSKMDERAAQREAARQEEERRKKKRRKAIDKAVKVASYII